MTWRIEFAAPAERDLLLIFNHLVGSYMAVGDSRAEATIRARQRIDGIFDDTGRIALAPQRGARHDDLVPGLRHLSLGKAAFWFLTDDAAQLVRILAIFFGPQDQQRRMLIRLLGNDDDG
ncbi:type II toxin-antitoxin system RelE/ParE family toxin [Gemmobacter sp.]|uniref:type II toxin-antitoxin system RelE/ParE family toxin n=1 Tax=Gemmobacter sp. TaxID=1898957 RepID=UPI002AFDE894|nr:type II toxin-antitoxin system RelE/ParE family toxin [Gemmobacter sp.]